MNLSSEDLDHILEKTDFLLDDLAGRRIFVTGGTGFIGKWLLESFSWANKHLNLKAKMLVLSPDPESFIKLHPGLIDAVGISYLKGDIRDFEFPELKFDFIIHAATDTNENLYKEKPLMMLDTIIDGTRRALEFSIHCGAKKFLLTSSGAVYGKQPSEISHLPEEFSGAPDTTQILSVYGEGKRVAELLCSIYNKQYGLETKIARCFAFVGPYMKLDAHYAIGNFILDGLKGRPIQVKGDGTPLRSYLYSADLAIWLWCILFRGHPGRVYNVGSDQAISIADVARVVSRCFQNISKIDIKHSSVSSNPVSRYVPSVDRAKRELDLYRWVELEESITKTIRFYEQS